MVTNLHLSSPRALGPRCPPGVASEAWTAQQEGLEGVSGTAAESGVLTGKLLPLTARPGAQPFLQKGAAPLPLAGQRHLVPGASVRFLTEQTLRACLPTVFQANAPSRPEAGSPTHLTLGSEILLHGTASLLCSKSSPGTLR